MENEKQNKLHCIFFIFIFIFIFMILRQFFVQYLIFIASLLSGITLSKKYSGA